MSEVRSAYDVRVFRGEDELFVYNLTVNTTHGQCNVTTTTPVVITESDEPIELRVQTAFDFFRLIARPLSAGVTPRRISDREFLVVLRPDSDLSIEFDGSRERVLHLFCNRCSVPPEPGAGVTIFPPGIHHAGVIAPPDNGIVYLAPGAFVFGRVEAAGVTGVRIYGSGILDGAELYEGAVASGYGVRPLPPPFDNRMIRLEKCENIRIEGIIVSNSPSWTIHLISCAGVEFRGVKVFGGRNNTDGFDLCGCRDILIDNCFTRVWDDSIAIKSFGQGNVEHIVVRNSRFWNDYAQSLEIGFELNCEFVRDVLFENCDILHNFWGGVLTIHNGNQAEVSNITYRDIRIEDAHAFIVQQWIGESFWLPGDRRGSIHDVLFENISVCGNFDPTRVIELTGCDETHAVSGLVIRNFSLQGRTVSDPWTVGVCRNGFAAMPAFAIVADET